MAIVILAKDHLDGQLRMRHALRHEGAGARIVQTPGRRKSDLLDGPQRFGFGNHALQRRDFSAMKPLGHHAGPHRHAHPIDGRDERRLPGNDPVPESARIAILHDRLAALTNIQDRVVIAEITGLPGHDIRTDQTRQGIHLLMQDLDHAQGGDTLIGHRLGPVKGVQNQKGNGAVDGDNQQQGCRKKEG